MSIYTDLQEEAKKSSKRWIELEDRIRSGMATLVSGFMQHCGIPDGRVRFSKWDGVIHNDGRLLYHLSSEDGIRYTLPGAITFGLDDGFWRLGVRVILTENSFPERYFFFPISLTERNGYLLLIWPPNGEEREVDINDDHKMRDFFDVIVESTRKIFKTDPISIERTQATPVDVQKVVGFHASMGTLEKHG